jgi:adenylate cyclase
VKNSAKSHRPRSQEEMAGLWMMAIASLAVTALILGLRALGTLEWIELVTYDWMVRRQPVRPPDARILVVGITEQDIQDRGGILQFPDQVYADLFSKLLAAKPRVVGLDIWRDRPVEPGHSAFVRQLQSSDRIIGITMFGDAAEPAIAPPKALPPEQVGFNDVLVDKDDVIRRILLFGPKPQPFRFSLHCAICEMTRLSRMRVRLTLTI